MIKKTAEANGDQTDNKITDAVAKSCDGRIAKSSKTFSNNSSQTVKSEHNKKKVLKKDLCIQKKDRNLSMI